MSTTLSTPMSAIMSATSSATLSTSMSTTSNITSKGISNHQLPSVGIFTHQGHISKVSLYSVISRASCVHEGSIIVKHHNVRKFPTLILSDQKRTQNIIILNWPWYFLEFLGPGEFGNCLVIFGIELGCHAERIPLFYWFHPLNIQDLSPNSIPYHSKLDKLR